MSKKLKIIQDIHPEDPRTAYDPMGTMVCKHRRYNLGDTSDTEAHEPPEGSVVLPLYLYDHGGLSISTSSWVGRARHAHWDSGQVGFIFVTPEQIANEYGSAQDAEIRAKEYLKGEVKIYDQYLRGSVWAFRVYETCEHCGQNAEEVNSCFGFFGDDLEETGIKDHVSNQYQFSDEEIEAAWDNRFN